jgi:bifunctional non-homologous end joining protein LigD
MRPVSGRPPLVSEAWIYEMKLDGYRLLADVQGGDVVLRYRSGRVCTAAFPELVTALQGLRSARLVLDGEVVAFDEQGRPDFDRLAPRLRRTTEPKPPVAYLVFDVLAVGDVDVRPAPLRSRKQLVERIVVRSKGALRLVPFVAGDGRELAAFIDEHDLEGLVAKRGDSPYRAGASPSWLKVKRRHEEEFLVTRYHCDRRGQIDALALATRQRGQLVPQGIVETGAGRLRGAVSPSGRYGWAAVSKRIVVTVTFTGRTSAGRLREAIVKGLRAEGV